MKSFVRFFDFIINNGKKEEFNEVYRIMHMARFSCDVCKSVLSAKDSKWQTSFSFLQSSAMRGPLSECHTVE